MTSKYPWKLLVVMHIGSMARMKDTTESSTIWKDQLFLIVMSTKTNGDVKQKYHTNFIDIEYTLLWITHHLTLHGMVKILVTMSLEHLYI